MEMRGLVWRHLIIAFSSFKHFVPPVSAVVHVPRLLFCVLVYSQESRRHRHTVRTGAQPQNGTRALSLSIYVPVIRSVCVCVHTALSSARIRTVYRFIFRFTDTHLTKACTRYLL